MIIASLSVPEEIALKLECVWPWNFNQTKHFILLSLGILYCIVSSSFLSFHFILFIHMYIVKFKKDTYISVSCFRIIGILSWQMDIFVSTWSGVSGSDDDDDDVAWYWTGLLNETLKCTQKNSRTTNCPSQFLRYVSIHIHPPFTSPFLISKGRLLWK